MQLSRAQALELARCLAAEPDKEVQKYLIQALARYGEEALKEAIRARCNYRVRIKIARAAAFYPNLLVWMFRRERAKAVKHVILDKLIEAGSCEALRRVADGWKDTNLVLLKKLASGLARAGFENKQPDLVWRALAFDAREATNTLVSCARSYVRLSSVQQKILLVAVSNPKLPDYLRDDLSRCLQPDHSLEHGL